MPVSAVAVPRPTIANRRATRKSSRGGSTRYWRNLIGLWTHAGTEGPQVTGQATSRNMVFRGRGSPGGHVQEHGPNWTTYRGEVSAGLSAFGRHAGSTSHVWAANGTGIHRSMRFDATDSTHPITQHGLTFVVCSVSDGVTTGSIQFNQDGGFNNANGFMALFNRTGDGRVSAQNGTASRGFGDSAELLHTGGQASLPSGALLVGFGQISAGGHIAAAWNRWDDTRQHWKQEADISGTFGFPGNIYSLSNGFGTTGPIHFGAMWKGCPFTYRDFLRDIAHRKDPIEIFYG